MKRAILPCILLGFVVAACGEPASSDDDGGGTGGSAGAGGHATGGGPGGGGGKGGGGGAGGTAGSPGGCGIEPVTPNATPKTRAALCYLYQEYGNHILAAQEENNDDNAMN